MTVRVLREGPASQSIVVNTTCTKCGSYLEYAKPDDVQRDGFKTSGFFFNDTAKVKQRDFIECPHCGEAVFV